MSKRPRLDEPYPFFEEKRKHFPRPIGILKKGKIRQFPFSKA